MKTRRLRVLCVFILSSFVGSTFAARPAEVTLTTGFDRSSGDFGQAAETTIESLPLTVRVDTREWVFKMQSSQLRIEQITEDGLTSKESGQGDTLLSVAKKSWFRWRGINYIDVGIRTKVPTADQDKRLGTGEADWMLQFDGYRQMGKWMPCGSVGYRWYGDSVEEPRDNGVYGSVGLNYNYSPRVSAGMLLDFRSANTSRIEDGEEMIPYMVFALNSRWSISVYGVFGLSKGSADNGSGLQLVYRQP